MEGARRVNIDYDIEDDDCVAGIAIKALVAPEDIQFSGQLVHDLAAKILELRSELLFQDLCETADKLAKRSVEGLLVEINVAAEWARAHL